MAGEERRLQVLEDDFARGFFVSVLCFCAEEEGGQGYGPLSRKALMEATLPCHIPGILRKVSATI
jgi:hypothetical protein